MISMILKDYICAMYRKMMYMQCLITEITKYVPNIREARQKTLKKF